LGVVRRSSGGWEARGRELRLRQRAGSVVGWRAYEIVASCNLWVKQDYG